MPKTQIRWTLYSRPSSGDVRYRLSLENTSLLPAAASADFIFQHQRVCRVGPSFLPSFSNLVSALRMKGSGGGEKWGRKEGGGGHGCIGA